METAAAEALLNVHPVNTNAKGLIHSIVPTDSGIPENTVPTAVILRQDNAKAVPAAVEARQNVLMETINVKALLPINALTVLGNGIKTALTAAIHQPANARVPAAEALLNVHPVIINAAVLIPTNALPVPGQKMNIVPVDAMPRQEHARNVRPEKNAKVLIHTLVQMVLGQRMSIVPTDATHLPVNAMSVRMETISAKVLIPINVHLVPGNLINIVPTDATHLPVNVQVTNLVSTNLTANISAQTAQL